MKERGNIARLGQPAPCSGMGQLELDGFTIPESPRRGLRCVCIPRRGGARRAGVVSLVEKKLAISSLGTGDHLIYKLIQTLFVFLLPATTLTAQLTTPLDIRQELAKLPDSTDHFEALADFGDSLTAYIATLPPTPDSLVPYLTLGKRLLDTRLYWAQPNLAIEDLGSRILDEVAIKLESAVQRDQLDKDDPFVQVTVNDLENYQILLDLGLTDTEKGVEHLRRGRLRYLLDRLWTDHPILLTACILTGLLLLYTVIYTARGHYWSWRRRSS